MVNRFVFLLYGMLVLELVPLRSTSTVNGAYVSNEASLTGDWSRYTDDPASTRSWDLRMKVIMVMVR